MPNVAVQQVTRTSSASSLMCGQTARRCLWNRALRMRWRNGPFARVPHLTCVRQSVITLRCISNPVDDLSHSSRLCCDMSSIWVD